MTGVTMMTSVSLKKCGGGDNEVPTQFRVSWPPLTLFIYLFTSILSHVITMDLSKIIQGS